MLWNRLVSGGAERRDSSLPISRRTAFRIDQTSAVLGLPYHLAQKAEALHLADRTSEALAAIKEAEKVVEKSEERQWCAELHRLRGVFLAAICADKTEIEASFCAAIRTANEQKSVSLTKRAESTYAAYQRGEL